MSNDTIVVRVEDLAKWLFWQFGQLILAVGLISLVFNYAYRFLVDWNASGVWFYVGTLALALIVFVVTRWDYIFINRFSFSTEKISIFTIFGAEKTYSTENYGWVPSLHKVVNFPEQAANLSFYVKNLKTGRNIRNYSWKGFSPRDFQKISRLYGYLGNTDFKQNDFGRN